jgi:hypothetical protein
VDLSTKVSPEVGNIAFLRDVGIYLQVHTAFQLKDQTRLVSFMSFFFFFAVLKIPGGKLLHHRSTCLRSDLNTKLGLMVDRHFVCIAIR